MTKNKFRIIVFLMGIALIGIVSLQYAMIRDSYAQKEQLFNQNVNAALFDVVKKVEKAEALDFIQMKQDNLNRIYISTLKSKSEQQNLIEDQARSKIDQRTLNTQRKRLRKLSDSLRSLEKSFSFTFSDNDFKIGIPNMEDFGDSIFKDFQHGEQTFVFNDDTITSLFMPKEKSAKAPKAKIIVRSGNISTTSPPVPPVPPHVVVGPIEFEKHPEAPKRNAAKKFFEKQDKPSVKVFQDLAAELNAERIPLEKRVKPGLIDSLLTAELLKRGISLDYNILINNKKDSKIFYSTSLPENFESPDVYTAVLFENTGLNDAATMNISFPDKRKSLSSEMGPVLASSALLLIVILAIFIYTIQAILKQKKLSDLKNDFINNMTHEFKTPVSTILLASEALKDSEVTKDEARVQRLANIIYDENLRLGEHVERVLNMARMDKGEIKLAMNSISVHCLIQEVVHHYELNLNNKNQKVVLKLTDASDSVYADSFHLKNIIQNLIDNASKYSKEGSTIFVETELYKDSFVLKVKDQGIGMKKDQIRKIFEPFYRVPTGNLHDVKGFGIGLHYVYSILKEMGGKISVRSEIGIGSEFTVNLPNSI